MPDSFKEIRESLKQNRIIKNKRLIITPVKKLIERFKEMNFKETEHYVDKYLTRKYTKRWSTYHKSLRKSIFEEDIHILLRKGKHMTKFSIHRDIKIKGKHKAIKMSKKVVEYIAKHL